MLALCRTPGGWKLHFHITHSKLTCQDQHQIQQQGKHHMQFQIAIRFKVQNQKSISKPINRYILNQNHKSILTQSE